MKKDQILLVDDEKVIRELGQEMFEILGYKCMTASGGEEGIDIFRRHSGRILLVVLDVEMPGMSGEIVSDVICRDFPGTKILFISGYDRDYLEQKVFRRKIENFMSKPLSVKSLSRKLGEILGKNAL